MGAMGHRIDPSEVCPVPASAPRIVLSWLWDGAYKIILAANRKE